MHKGKISRTFFPTDTLIKHVFGCQGLQLLELARFPYMVLLCIFVYIYMYVYSHELFTWLVVNNLVFVLVINI